MAGRGRMGSGEQAEKNSMAKGWNYWQGECNDAPKVTEGLEKRGWPQDAGYWNREEREEKEGKMRGRIKLSYRSGVSSLEYLARKT